MILIQDRQGIIGMRELRDMFNEAGCDKAEKHSYDKIYDPEFSSVREDKINILEVGIFKGDSIKAWLEYFPNATIYGIDIFTRIKTEDIEVLKDPRVKWLKADSTNASIATKIKSEWPRIRFDIIIDDGLHTPEANAKTLENLYPLLKKNGRYYVEDVFPFDIMTTEEWNHPWVKKHPDRYNPLKWSIFERQIQDKKVTRFDNRKLSGEPDSYIIKVI